MSIETGTEATYKWPSLEEVMVSMGHAGAHIAAIEASEGAAGNISVLCGWEIDPPAGFNQVEKTEAATSCPDLVGACFLVSGSGRRLREIGDAPDRNLAFVRITGTGDTMEVWHSCNRLYQRPTSEFNSHLAIHSGHAAHTKRLHTVLHGQPLHITYLSHIEKYQSTEAMNRGLLRWQPELIINLPDGVEVLPFEVPGSPELMRRNIAGLKNHQVVLWCKHGVMARCHDSVMHAADLVEYVETGAKYEFLNLSSGGLGQGLSDDELHRICVAFKLNQTLY